MNTNNIKSFAKQARLILMEGVKQRLLYWGFDANGNNIETVETTTGGYLFRGNVFNDESVPPKWQKLKTKLTSKQAIQDTIEEAAYTWFNRLMAINILEKRGYIQPTLTYTTELKTPQIVQNAKRGQHQLKQQKYIDLLQQYLVDDQEEQALGLLLTRLCNNNILLHDVFGRIDDYTEILLPNNLLQRNGIIDLLNSDVITTTEYKEVELIGWLYQFYISDKKDEVFKGFKANKKARPEDIPAATQIFTPKWIVKYMVENTVGKIYLDFDKASSLKPEMKYLVVNEAEETIHNSQLTIHNLEDLTLIDPASGSGHILVTGFELLFKMYREQGYTAKNAVISILQNNLFGLDIDDRAMQLARFAVLLKAAEFYPEVLKASDNNPLLLPHIYSFPEIHHFQLQELQSFLTPQGATYVIELKEALALLNQGKNIGAALKIELSQKAHTFITTRLHDWNTQALTGTLDILQQDLWNNLKPFLEVLLVMTKKYTAVVANPPYMGQKSMNAELKNYVNDNYQLSKSDLFAVFMEVCLSMNLQKGLMGMINQHSWMFLSSYEKLREDIVSNYGIINMLHLGAGTFEEISGEVVQSTTFIIKNEKPVKSLKGIFYRLLKTKSEDREKDFLQHKFIFNRIEQKDFKLVNGTPISYWISSKIQEIFTTSQLIKEMYSPRQGMSTGKNDMFLRYIHELDKNKIGFPYDKSKKWSLYYKGGGYRKWYGNVDMLINWQNDGEKVKKYKGSVIRNSNYYFKKSLSWTLMGSKSFGLRFNYPAIFDAGSSSLFVEDEYYEIVGALMNSCVVNELLQAINPTSNFSNGVIGVVPVILPTEKLLLNKIKELTIENIKISIKDNNKLDTEWNFEQSPLLNKSTSIKEAVQKWQGNVTEDFFKLHENEEELNRIFIAVYGLQEELTPEVALKDITILQEELNGKGLEQLETTFRSQGKNAVVLPIKKDQVINQFISYCIGIFMGRYRLDQPGLHVAHPNPTEKELQDYVIPSQGENSSTINNSPLTIDEDAIIPIMGSECAFPDDALVRIKNLIHDLWGEATLTENLNFINECLGVDLDKYLNEQFWKDHTSRYKKKPIYWLFSSNPSKPNTAAFKVLVYMHRMDKYTVSKIQRNYLHPHQEWIKQERDKLIENESNLSKNELKRLEKLRSWELECRDYNEILKTLALQEIVFDLDDGVSVNYEKFESAVAKI